MFSQPQDVLTSLSKHVMASTSCGSSTMEPISWLKVILDFRL